MSFDAGTTAVAQDGPPAALREAAPAQEYSCAGCGYGIAVARQLPPCPMCGGDAWEPLRDARRRSVSSSRL